MAGEPREATPRVIRIAGKKRSKKPRFSRTALICALSCHIGPSLSCMQLDCFLFAWYRSIPHFRRGALFGSTSAQSFRFCKGHAQVAEKAPPSSLLTTTFSRHLARSHHVRWSCRCLRLSRSRDGFFASVAIVFATSSAEEDQSELLSLSTTQVEMRSCSSMLVVPSQRHCAAMCRSKQRWWCWYLCCCYYRLFVICSASNCSRPHLRCRPLDRVHDSASIFDTIRVHACRP